MNKHKSLVTLESVYAMNMERILRTIEKLHREVLPTAIEDFEAHAAGFRLEPVGDFPAFIKRLPTEFVLESEGIIRARIHKAQTLHKGSCGFAIYNTRDELVGFVLTDLFLDKPLWVFKSIYSAAGGAIEALLTPCLQMYADVLRPLKDFHDIS